MVTRDVSAAYGNLVQEAQLELFLRRHHSQCGIASEKDLRCSKDTTCPGEERCVQEADSSHIAGEDAASFYSNVISDFDDCDESRWSRDEIELFLAAVSRHGRRQPERISADLGYTKSTGDVVRLIVSFERRRQGRHENEDDDESYSSVASDDTSSLSSNDAESDAASTTSSQRRTGRLLTSIAAAYEMSETWLDFEEEIAQELDPDDLLLPVESDFKHKNVDNRFTMESKREAEHSRHKFESGHGVESSASPPHPGYSGLVRPRQSRAALYTASHHNILEMTDLRVEQMQAYLDGVRQPVSERKSQNVRIGSEAFVVCESDALLPPRLSGKSAEETGDADESDTSSATGSSVYDDYAQHEIVLARREARRGATPESTSETSSRMSLSGYISSSEARDVVDEQRWRTIDRNDMRRAHTAEERLWKAMGADAQTWRRAHEQLAAEPKPEDCATPALTLDDDDKIDEDNAGPSQSSLRSAEHNAHTSDLSAFLGTDWTIPSKKPEDHLAVWLEKSMYSRGEE